MDLRRGSRVSARFSVAVEGVDERLVVRHGDLSATGIYFESPTGGLGDPGTVHWLRIGPADAAGAHASSTAAPPGTLRVMACLVRSATVADLGGSLHGVAFEFMPDSDVAAVALVRFVRRLLEVRSDGSEPTLHTAMPASARPSAAPPPPPRASSPAAPAPPAVTTIRSLSVRSMVLETSWALEPGESVRVDIVAPGMTRRLRLDGKAVRVAPRSAAPGAPSRFDIELAIEGEKDRPVRRHSSTAFEAITPDAIARAIEARVAARAAEARGDAPPASSDAGADAGVDPGALDDLLAALILPPAAGARRATHLTGSLDRVQFPTLCSILEMERLTGRLELDGPAGERLTLWTRDGAFVDAAPLREGEAPRAAVARAMRWTSGTFAFEAEPVERDDRVATRMTALVLDLAREQDEAGRGLAATG